MAQQKTKQKAPKLTAAQSAVLGALVNAGTDGLTREAWKKTPTRTLSVLSESGYAKKKVAKNGTTRVPTWFATLEGKKVLATLE